MAALGQGPSATAFVLPSVCVGLTQCVCVGRGGIMCGGVGVVLLVCENLEKHTEVLECDR